MPPVQIRRWHVYSDTASLRQDVVDALIVVANHSIKQRGRFCIVLAGGRTPASIYQALRHAATDWSGWHIYFGDERCLPVGDPERNDCMARSCWLDHVPVPEKQIHPIPAELGSEVGARAYEKVIAGIDRFDLVLLGLGEDGHTASLFPGYELGTDQAAPAVLTVRDAPKPPPERISLSARRLSTSDRLWFIVAGADKAQALEMWRHDRDIPARFICPERGVDIYTDIDVVDTG
ncbi:MAG: 6-phosphogluconolactonase [Proteobacteria bacterium]|jgi:6-phosphogluconolactonase|nr:6-phosphogluconolactonase [Pseudomonadota bacterium]